MCLERVLRKRDGSKVRDEEIEGKTTYYTVFPLVQLYLKEMNIKKRYRKLKGKSFHLIVIILVSSNIFIKR